jgi:adenosylhomocysteine nucleosidase
VLRRVAVWWLMVSIGLFAIHAPAQAEPRWLDPTPRTAVVSAFEPELAELLAATRGKTVHVLNGAVFTTGVLEGRPVVLLLSGMSMVNAAMRTQQVLDRFDVRRIVFSGIAGGVDPALHVGDVIVPDRWAQYQESVMAREAAPGQFAPPPQEPITAPAFGMMFPKAVEIAREPGKVTPQAWFPADPQLLMTAQRVAGSVRLKRCAQTDLCLGDAPKLVVGGAGVSGQAFVDNAALRAWLSSAFSAQAVDMESAAVAQVAYLNRTPFIAFRSLSDLAGGEPGANQARIFFQLAADNSALVVRTFLAAAP